jgi:hypothetical protein
MLLWYVLPPELLEGGLPAVGWMEAGSMELEGGTKMGVGCPAHVYIQPSHRSKLNDRSRPGIYLGPVNNNSLPSCLLIYQALYSEGGPTIVEPLTTHLLD